MIIQEEINQIFTECLNRIGQEYKISFNKFEIEQHTQGHYRSGTWTYKISGDRVSIEYWFSAFSSRKEETPVTYQKDKDEKKLEDDLRKCLEKVREAVKRKKGLF